VFTAESDGERILKIDQHLAKLWAVRFFLWNTLYCCQGNKMSQFITICWWLY